MFQNLVEKWMKFDMTKFGVKSSHGYSIRVGDKMEILGFV